MGVLKKVFGPSREEVWRELAEQLRGQFFHGGFWKGDKVVVRPGEWTVTLDTFTVSNGKSSSTFTRLVAPFDNPDGFHFSVGRAHLFSGIARWLGFQDITIGDPEFDAAFVVKGDNERKVREFFANGRLRSILSRQPHVSFEVQRAPSGLFSSGLLPGVDQLRFVSPGVIKDLEQLKELFNLFSWSLRQTTHISSAYETDPELDPTVRERIRE